MGKTKRERKKILVIDDEGDLLKVTRVRLEASGYIVITLTSGERAVEVAKAEKPDLIILDLVMPGKGGGDVCSELKADEYIRNIPVIIFTAHYPEEEYLGDYSGTVGAEGFMTKPFEPQQLLDKIESLLK